MLTTFKENKSLVVKAYNNPTLSNFRALCDFILKNDLIKKGNEWEYTFLSNLFIEIWINEENYVDGFIWKIEDLKEENKSNKLETEYLESIEDIFSWEGIEGVFSHIVKSIINLCDDFYEIMM